MIYLRQITKIREYPNQSYPFALPLLKRFQPFSFAQPVTILCGDNGCGKTTLLELLSFGTLANRIGPGLETLTPTQTLLKAASGSFRMVMNRRPARSFHFTAEGFSKYVDYVIAEKNYARQELDSLHGRYGSAYAEELAAQPYAATLGALEGMYKGNLEEQSHGQGFIDFFRSRLIPGGLYLMDEPEAALSYVNQLALIFLMQDAVKQNCQFILATHSPILTAYPGACLYEMEEGELTEKRYEELNSILFLQHFLRAHEHVLSET